jgi:hypothetical protein
MDTVSSKLFTKTQNNLLAHNVGQNSRKKGQKVQIKLIPHNTSKNPAAQSYSKQTII